MRQPSQVSLPKRELRSRYFQHLQKRPRQSPSPELTSKRACGDMLVTETPRRPATERQTKHWEALKDLKSPDQTTKPAKSNLGNGSLSPLNSTLPSICPSSKINFSPLQSESTGEHFVIPPNKVRLENTNDKSKWQMPTLSKPMLIVGDSLLSSINSIRQSAANLTQISLPGAKYVHF